LIGNPGVIDVSCLRNSLRTISFGGEGTFNVGGASPSIDAAPLMRAAFSTMRGGRCDSMEVTGQ
jgi:hypothetical protein